MADADNDNPNTPKHLEDARTVQRMYRLLMAQLSVMESNEQRLSVIAMMAGGAALFATGDKAKATAFLTEQWAPNVPNMVDAAEADFHMLNRDRAIKQAVRPNRFIPPKKDKPS
jgi:hypothetical protein